MANSKKVLSGIAAGVIGGLAASFVMDEFQALLKHAEGPGRAQQPGNGGEPATVRAGRAIAEPVLQRGLREDEKKVAGPAMHFAMGALSGGLYGAAVEAIPLAGAGFGSLFGAVLWAVADEAILPALGLSKKPTEYPALTHTNALASHVVYGITTDVVRRLLAPRLASI